MKKPVFKVDEELKKVAQECADKIAQSAAFLVIFNQSMVDDVVPLIQMGLAVYMDKPIYLVVPEGIDIPPNLRRLALKIEYFKRELSPAGKRSLEEATSRLLKDFGKP